MATLELRPRSATEIVDASFQLLRANFSPLVTISVAAQLPVLAIRIWLVRIGLGAGTAPSEVAAQFAQAIGSVLVIGVIIIFLAILAQFVIIVAASQAYLGLAIDPGAAFRRGLQRFFWVVLTYLLVGFGFGVAFAIAAFLPAAVRVIIVLVLVLVSIVVALRLIPLNCVAVLEDANPVDVVKRTLFLGQGLIGHMFLTMLLGGLIYFGIALIAGVLVAVLAAIVPALKDPNVGAVFQTAAAALVYPLIIAISVVLYYDLRIRREGFDVEMMSRAMPR